MLTPQITNIQPGAVTTETISGKTFLSVDVTLTVDPEIGKDQRVMLLLNEDTTTDPNAYSFSAKPLSADSVKVVFPVKRVRPGDLPRPRPGRRRRVQARARRRHLRQAGC